MSERHYKFGQAENTAQVYRSLLAEESFFGAASITVDTVAATADGPLGMLYTRKIDAVVQSLPRACRVVVCVATYQRRDGSTKQKLRRFLKSLIEQTFQQYALLLIGDSYEDGAEFDAFLNELDTSRYFALNLPVAAERHDSTLSTPRQLWMCGGTTAMNYGLMICQARDQQLDTIYVHCDDDDCWQVNHLQSIVDVFEQRSSVCFVYTMSTLVNRGVVPSDVTDYLRPNCDEFMTRPTAECLVEKLPAPCNMVHSAAAWRVTKIPTRYQIAIGQPGDALMWHNISKYMQANNLLSILVKKLTVVHDTQTF